MFIIKIFVFKDNLKGAKRSVVCKAVGNQLFSKYFRSCQK